MNSVWKRSTAREKLMAMALAIGAPDGILRAAHASPIVSAVNCGRGLREGGLKSDICVRTQICRDEKVGISTSTLRMGGKTGVYAGSVLAPSSDFSPEVPWTSIAWLLRRSRSHRR